MDSSSRNRKRMVLWMVVIGAALAGTAAWVAGCSTPPPLSPVDLSKVRDGVYEGETWKILVAVKVDKGRIVAIELKKQLAPQKYTDTVKTLIPTIIEKQTTGVDDITGATMSCQHLKRAVHAALTKAAAAAGTASETPAKPTDPVANP